ncbi:MAG: multidrug transporter [Bacillus thermozeamaize]|jgi:DHA1 family multidrug resistance protein-like MFS transporter|uniref:Multidrug transporter n=1 Tax=Bacillus thermozeamaize TaxID=230954 RepID=A0A1Y3PBH1_9BACI|nr:MAG: multidrug transporter [Bacillus thermozeamaize]
MKKGQLRKGPLIILMVNMFIGMIGIGLVIPVLPAFLESFGASGQTLGLLVATFSLTQFLFSPMAGELSDKYGRRKFILLGMGCFALSELLFAVSQSLWLLYVSRLLGGVSAAFLVPAVMAYVADITSEEMRAKGLGLLGAAMSLGFVIGPGLGGFLAEYGVRIPFYFASGVAVAALILSFFLLPETLSKKAQLKARRALKKGESFFRQLLRSTRAPYAILLLLVLAMSFGLANYESIFGLFVDQRFGFTPKDIAIVITSAAILGVLIQAVVVNKLVALFGESKVVNGSLAFTAISYLFILFARGFWSVLVVTLLTFLATSILRPAINTLLSKMAGDEQGYVAGMNNAYMSIGNVLGPAVAGFLYDVNMSWPFLVGSAVFALCFGVSVLWTRQQAVRQQEMT